MTELTELICEYLSEALTGYTVTTAFAPAAAEQPLKRNTVFVMPQSIENGRMELIVSVCVPLAAGGIGCFNEAEQVSELLKSSDCPVKLDNVAVREVKYNRNDRAFTCAVSAAADKNESKRFYFRAELFENDPGKTVSCGISHYTIKRHFGNYPVMTIFDEIPTDIINRENVYDITLPEVPVLFIDDLAESGRFRLTVNGMSFDDCYCVESTDDQTKKATVVVRGYSDRYIEPDPLPPDIPIT